MGRREILVLLLGVALGANVVLGAMVVSSSQQTTQPAWAQTVDSGSGITVATGNLKNQNGDALYVLDTANKKLAVYFVNNKVLALTHVRDVGFDLGISASFGLQDPSKKDLKKATEKKK